MKFGRYLRDHLTPEWKRAYIDYSACKKAIKVITRRLDQAGTGESEDEQGSSDLDADHGPSKPRAATSLRESSRGSLRSPRTNGSTRTERTPGTALTAQDSRTPTGNATTTLSPREIPRRPSPPPPLDLGESSYGRVPDPQLAEPPKQRRAATISEEPAHVIQTRDSSSPEDSNQEQDTEISDSGRMLTSPGTFKIKSMLSPKLGKSPRFFTSPRMSPGDSSKSAKGERSPKSPQVGRRSLRSMTMPSPRVPAVVAETFEDLYDQLEDDERAFFDLLDRELDKVQQFYSARQNEAVARAAELKDQLSKLGEHRKRYHELYPAGITGAILPPQQAITLTKAADKLRLRVPFIHDGDNHPSLSHPPTNGRPDGVSRANSGDALGEPSSASAGYGSYNPERYQHYKRELRTATLDFYRHLERIKNYRILNLTGFRKALKKFEKATNVHCMEMYTDEKISKESFAKGEVVEKLLDEMEDLYSEHFEHGDSKKARDRLRRQSDITTHHYSVFRSGIYIGLGLPAAIFALVLSRQEEAQMAIPANEALLQVYGALFIPVIFGMLLELNLHAFVTARINYEFVMELTKPTLDHRSFLEIPAFLFLTLSYCFFFSFNRVGASNVAPTTWPVAWLIFVVVFFLNPLDVFRRSSRYWLLRVLFRVCTPGYSRVEFIAFFLADEMNSLVYSFENVYFMACSYTKHWPADTFRQCPVGQRWPYGLILALPPLSRLIQCLKRYHDSNIGIHLINAGKYFSVIAQYSLFVLWRSRGSDFQDPAFIVWIIVAAAAAAYTSAWDLIVDWSLFRPNSALLRKDRGYSSRYVYYFAMITNVLIRWEWVWYLPHSRHHVRLRTFFLAFAEMLRRWQWNFFRVETEHLGNADAYRVTREIPLPYRRVEPDSEEDEMAVPRHTKPQGTIGIQLKRLKSEILGHNAKRDQDDAGTQGGRKHTAQRDYEAGKRLDVVPTRSRSHQSPEV